jgi:hypothetical protein
MQIVNYKLFYSHRKTSRFVLWKKWVLVNAIAELFCLIIIAFVSTIVSPHGNPNPQEILVLIGIFQGLILGFAQCLALRRYIRNFFWWILATVIGWLLGWLAMLFVAIITAIVSVLAPNSLDTITLFVRVVWLGAAMGTLIGLAQGLVFFVYLKIPIYKAVWWMNSNALAWALRFLLGFVVASLQLDGFYVSTALIMLGTGAVMLVIPGVITGIILVYLLTLERLHKVTNGSKDKLFY